MSKEVHSVIQNLKSYIQKHAPKKDQELLQKFVDIYFISVALDELQERPIEELYAVVNAHFHFIQKRMEGEIKLRVYNPEIKRDGYTSPHSIVELDQDD